MENAQNRIKLKKLIMNSMSKIVNNKSIIIQSKFQITILK